MTGLPETFGRPEGTVDANPSRPQVISREWHVAARCRDSDLALFFHPDGERGHDRRHRQLLAKQVCAECPVMTQCRTHALAFEEPFGTWGGLSEDDRSRLLPERAVNLRTHREPTPPTRPAVPEA